MPRLPATPEQRAVSRAAANKRWDAATPEERKAQGAIMTAGLLNSYRVKARQIAQANGWTPTDADVETSAIALRKADIAMGQVRAIEAMRTKPAPGHHVHVPDIAEMNLRAMVAASQPAPATDEDLAELNAAIDRGEMVPATPAAIEALTKALEASHLRRQAEAKAEYDAIIAAMTAAAKVIR